MKLLHFAKYLIEVAGKVACKKKKVAYKIPGTSLLHKF